MPRYFFHEPSTDTERHELPDDEAASREATTFAFHLLQDMRGRFKPDQEWHLEVTNEAGMSIHLRRCEQSSKAASVDSSFSRDCAGSEGAAFQRPLAG